MQNEGTPLPAGKGAGSRDPARKSQIAYTVAEFAELLGKNPNTVYDWIRKGSVPSERIGGTYFIPRWALAPLLSPTGDSRAPSASAPTGGEAA
jgi:excisionase family DNA binding protein